MKFQFGQTQLRFSIKEVFFFFMINNVNKTFYTLFKKVVAERCVGFIRIESERGTMARKVK